MTAQDDLDRRLSEWISVAASGPVPEGRFERAMHATARVRPRPRWLAHIGSDRVDGSGSSRLHSPLSKPRRWDIAVTAVAVLGVVAIIGTSLVAAPVEGPGLRPSAAPVSQGPVVTSPPGGYVPPTLGPDLLSTPARPMSAGRHHLDVHLRVHPRVVVDPGDGSSPYPATSAIARVSFDLPAGWSGNDRVIVKGDAQAPDGLSFAPWTIQTIHRIPCSATQQTTEDPPNLWTVDGLTGAVQRWWPGSDSRSPVASKPTDVTLSDLPGRYLEVEAPADLDLGACLDGKSVLWLDDGNVERYLRGPGERTRLWILDLVPSHPGGLLVIEASSYPATSAQDLAELQGIVDSIGIEVTYSG
jgi:hypothetical protein